MTLLVHRNSAPVPPNSKLFGEVQGVKVFNSSYTGFPKHDVVYDNPNYARERKHALEFKCKDGVKPFTKEEQDFERSVTWAFIKKMTWSIFKMDFAHISFPVAYSEPRSFLERTADLITFLVHPYIEKAIAAKGDPVKQLKYVAIGIVSGFHLHMQSKKPWNPILGETYVGRWPNGTIIYAEQISHHPPISSFQIFGSGWECSAQNHFEVSVGITEVDINQSGIFSLSISDIKYEFEFPNIAVFGIIRGDRIVRMMNSFCVKDITNNLECPLTFHPRVNNVKGLNKDDHTSVYGGVRKIGSDQFISEIVGDYCDKLVSDEEVLWDIRKDFATRPLEPVEDELLLPSDSRFRIDRAQFIKQTDNEAADEAKVMMEEAQRFDRQLRSKGVKK